MGNYMSSNSLVRENRKIKYRVILVFTIFLLLSLTYAGASLIYGEFAEETQLPAFLGNKPDNIDLLRDKDTGSGPFSFFIAGDIQQGDFFPDIYKNSIEGDSPDFGVILGDFVKTPRMEPHTEFIRDFSTWGIREPLFLVCGNHDIITEEDERHNRLFLNFTLKEFERTYGPADFSFTYHGCLFVVLDDIDTDAHVAYLDDVLSHRKKDTPMTFVFTHIPPHTISPAIKCREMLGEKEFLSLIDEYNVDYVISGDFHSYCRARVKNTNFVVSGGGMDRDGDNSRNRKGSYHAMLFQVDPNMKTVDERIYTGKSRFALAGLLKRNMFLQVFPFIEYQEKAGLPVIWGGALITAFLGLWLFLLSMESKWGSVVISNGGSSLALMGFSVVKPSADIARPRYGSGGVPPLRKRMRTAIKELDPLRGAIALLQHILVAGAGLRSSRYYQPIYGGRSTESKRDCVKRWDAMERYLPSYPFSFLDTGSEIGYFTFKAAENGAVAFGVERKKKLSDLAMTIRSVRKSGHTAFLNVGIDINTVRSLPQVDVLCCLSIFHHWVSEWGFGTADTILSILCEKTTSIFFETGQPNESVSWTAKVAFMEPDIEGWITKYLIGKGFSKVKCLGEYPTNRGDTRLLFFASK